MFDLDGGLYNAVAKGLGYSDETEAGTIADILLYAQVRGNSQVRHAGKQTRLVRVGMRTLRLNQHQLCVCRVSSSSLQTGYHGQSLVVATISPPSSRPSCLPGSMGMGLQVGGLCAGFAHNACTTSLCSLLGINHSVTAPALGMLVMNAACELAVKKAQEHGFGIVATHGTSSGTGAIGYFGHSIAKR